MTWWMTLLLVLAILVLIGCIPVGIDAVYREKAAVLKLKVGPFHFRLESDGEKKPKKEKKPAKKAKQEPVKDKAQSGEKKKGFPTDLSSILELLRFAGKVLGDLRRKIRIELLELHVLFGGEDDPARAAIGYGRMWAAVGALTPELNRLFVIKKRDIRPILDYNVDKQEIDAHLVLTITVGRALMLALKAGVGLLKFFANQKKAV